MALITLLGIAAGLAMDAFAVSAASGLAMKQLRIRHALRIAFWFGLFQGVMPVIGWLAGLTLRDFIGHIDHWIAFGLLAAIGCKMIRESFRMDPDRERNDPLNILVLLGLSIATSIDALAVGISFALLGVSIAAPALIIGVVTFIISFAGVYIGDRIGHVCESRIEILGGIVLIAIGIKILAEHS